MPIYEQANPVGTPLYIVKDPSSVALTILVHYVTIYFH